MAGELVKGLIGKEDCNIQYNTNASETFERTSSTGGTTTVTKIPDIWGGTGKIDVAQALINDIDFADHSARHENGGADEISVTDLSGLLADDQHVLDAEVKLIKLDDFAAPDDNTDLNVSITKHGLCPKAPNDTNQFLRGDGTWAGEKTVQVVNTQTGAVATGTTILPYDDTIPQITEGDEYMTLAITPTLATNKLKIDVVVHLRNSVGATMVAALFQDTTAGALAVGMGSHGTNEPAEIKFTHYMTAGTISATTFKIRGGNANAGTTTFNGNASGRLFGGVFASSITITEISA